MASDNLRVFGLLLIAFAFCALLYVGIDSASLEGEILGLSFSVAGPAATFPVLVLIFHFTGLFETGSDEERRLAKPPARMTSEQIAEELQDLDFRISRLEHRREQLRRMRDMQAGGADYGDTAAAGGIRVARRGGQALATAPTARP